MNFRYKLMRFLSGRYGVDTLFYVLFGTAVVLSFLNCFLRLTVLQIIVYLIIIFALFRMFSRNISARQKENRIFADISLKISKYIQTKRQQRADYTHIYRKCPRCGATLRLPRRKGKHKTVCPKCSNEFTVRVYK